MTSSALPPDVEEFMDFIGMNIKASGGFVWNERDKIKSDMMKVPRRWRSDRVPVDAFRHKCESIGMTTEEAREVANWLSRRQAGRRLVPQFDKKFRWHQDPE
ncbi:MAG: hypothetical protein HOZ81_32795 [Streptomyces sp.]|nr:hypothetical protein [Streptomyces sp.]NUS89454.1 hypothetical protein [Streptomyces sp.]